MKLALKYRVATALLALLCLVLTGCYSAAPTPSRPVHQDTSQTPGPTVPPAPTDTDIAGPADPDPVEPSDPPDGPSSPPVIDPELEPTPDPTPTPTTDTSTGSPAAGGGTYMLRVNKSTNVVTAYTWDGSGAYTVPVRAMICSTGGDYTPNGTYHLLRKYRWLALIHNVWGQYCSQIVGDILFHTVPALWPDEAGVQTEEFNKLGTVASAGCIRLTAVDSYWIYTNCAVGETRVEIGYFGEEGDPLGKPAVIKMPTDVRTDWDPYDVNPNNPWNDKSPWLEGIHDFTVDAGHDAPDWLEGVTGYDTCGNDWTEWIEVDDTLVDLSTPGDYTVTYTMTDLLGRTATGSAAVSVLPAEEEPEPAPVETDEPDPSPAPTEETDFIPPV